EDSLYALGDLAGSHAVEGAEIGDHLARGEAFVERGGTGKVADALADLLRMLTDVVPGNGGRAGRRLQDGGEHAQQRRLAGPVGAEETEYLPRTAAERDVVDGVDVAPLLIVKVLAEMLRVDHGRA